MGEPVHRHGREYMTETSASPGAGPDVLVYQKRAARRGRDGRRPGDAELCVSTTGTDATGWSS